MTLRVTSNLISNNNDLQKGHKKTKRNASETQNAARISKPSTSSTLDMAGAAVAKSGDTMAKGFKDRLDAKYRAKGKKAEVPAKAEKAKACGFGRHRCCYFIFGSLLF